MHEQDIYFDRNDKDTWAMARLHHSLLLKIQESPLWENEEIPDIPLTEAQMVALVKSYSPGWECRYAPYLLGGWFYITRSGWWLKKFKYQKGSDSLYHVTEHDTTEKERGHNLLAQVLIEGYFEDNFRDERLCSILREINIFNMHDHNNASRIHGFEPLLCDEPRILILGTLPGGESLTHRQYYYSNSNRIWKVLCQLTGEEMPVDYSQKKAFLARHHIVLWDYYESALRPNSSVDKDIRDGKPNDIIGFMSQYPTIKVIAINGFGKYKDFGARIKKELSGITNMSDVKVLRLPETSGSNQNYGWGDLNKLSAEWRQIFD